MYSLHGIELQSHVCPFGHCLAISLSFHVYISTVYIFLSMHNWVTPSVPISLLQLLQCCGQLRTTSSVHDHPLIHPPTLLILHHSYSSPPQTTTTTHLVCHYQQRYSPAQLLVDIRTPRNPQEQRIKRFGSVAQPSLPQ